MYPLKAVKPRCLSALEKALKIDLYLCFLVVLASTGQVFYFGFDRVSGSAVYDDSGSGNNGELTSLATVTKTSGNCGNGLQLHGGE